MVVKSKPVTIPSVSSLHKLRPVAGVVAVGKWWTVKSILTGLKVISSGVKRYEVVPSVDVSIVGGVQDPVRGVTSSECVGKVTVTPSQNGSLGIKKGLIYVVVT